jgi:hypothetical protein
MKTKLNSLGLAALLAIIVGCATTGASVLAPSIVKIAVHFGASLGIQKDPAALPYLEAATPIICSMSGSGPVDPAAIVAALESSGASALKTPAAVLIINGALDIYEAVYDHYGSNVQASVVAPYLVAVCQGLTEALPASKASPVTAEQNAKAREALAALTYPDGRRAWPKVK